MKQRKLLLIENRFKSQLISLFIQIVNAEKENYKSEIDKLELKYPIPSYLSIGDSNSGYCNCFLISKDLPDWFQEFLFECYDIAQKTCKNEIA